MRLQDKIKSVVLPFSSYNGWTEPYMLYIPLVILKFTHNRCNKVKIFKLALIDYMFYHNF